MTEVVVKVDDKPVDYLSPINIVINRGTEPSLIDMLVGDSGGNVTRWDDSKNPVEITIEAPDSSGVQTQLKLEKWNITHMRPESPGIWRVTLQDVRWTARHRRITAEYNVYVSTGDPDGAEARQSSLEGGSDWTCYDAAKDAIERFGLEFEEDKKLPSDLKQVPLPKNLGNSLSGGFINAGWDSTLPVLLDPIHCDTVVLPNGKITITDRNSERSDKLDQYIAVGGYVDDMKKDWSKPKKMNVLFETTIERFFTADDSETASSSDDIDIEMVIPREVSDPQGGLMPHGHVEFFSEVRNKWGLGPSQIRERWLKPRIIPYDDQNDDLEDIEEKDLWEGWIRECYLQKFRVKDTADRSLVGLQFGHLAADGSIRSDRCVYMPYSYIKKYTTVYKHQKLNAILDIPISVNKFKNFERPAPWLPGFEIDQDTGEVLFRLIPQLSLARFARELIPNTTVEPISPGGAIAIGEDGELEEVESQTALNPGWSVHVFYHGKLIEDRPDLGVERIHTEEVDMFEEGHLEYIDVRVPDTTANWGYNSPADMFSDNLTLLNQEQLDDRAEEIADQVKRNFNDGKAGIFWTGGVDAIVKGEHWVKGNIHSLSIMIGSKKEYTVECQWMVMPEVRPIYTQRLQLDGVPTRLIG